MIVDQSNLIKKNFNSRKDVLIEMIEGLIKGRIEALIEGLIGGGMDVCQNWGDTLPKIGGIHIGYLNLRLQAGGSLENICLY